ncbi:MAG: undecaprenyldiphospho-muramoylpentapeptide beta-N-acetylglucosaminyltransferase [Bacteroidota bacterium]|nr:undecaprenyldiphospho-muramoylpentapeptide beta-N-acetylglucosaminyltransferase [Bacteroidota bacterium]MDP4250432.1 undecaprenyldiphospho-muramoylpentapeptide beta-N-acetylglucosaminyltransferase [Bacteroidota bacterium]
MSKRIIIAGGGTGGHIFPALAIANALKKKEPDIEILFVGAEGKMEMEKVPEAGYRIEGIDIAGFNRSSLIKNIGLPYKLIRSFFRVRRIFQAFRPDAAIGVGGYSTFPVLRYAQAKGIPTFIHESNSFAGKSNILLGKKATRIFTASDRMEKFFPVNRLMHTGNPVRTQIVGNNISRAEGLAFFGLDANHTTVLITGGSLGAKSINEAIDAGIPLLKKNQIQLIWQTGKTFAAKAAEHAAESRLIWASQFIAKMEYAYAAADMVVSRSGSTLYELCAVKKPVIFVPYPHATEDHQTVNAQNLFNKQAALMIPDKEAKNKLVAALIDLAHNPAEQQLLKENIGRLAITDADEKIATEILKVIHG